MRTTVRRSIQIVSAVCLTYLLWRQNFITAVRPLYSWASWLDPLAGLVNLLRGTLPLLSLISLASLLIAVFLGRVFCGYVCPVGTLLDLIADLKKAVHWGGLRPGDKTRVWLERLRWIILGEAVGLILLGYSLALFVDPLVLWPRDFWLLINKEIPWSLIAVVLLGMVSFPRFWCRFVCPAGSTFSLAGRMRGASRLAGGKCTKCRVCVRHCPMMNVSSEIGFGSDCLHCGVCSRKCPVQCLDKPAAAASVDAGRRDLLLSSVAGLGLLAVGGIARAVKGETVIGGRRWARLLRPPGALEERDFLAACQRCGQCLSVCPTKVLRPSGLESGLLGLWTPRFVPRLGRCMFCNACDQVCPTKALAVMPPEKLRLGTAVIHRHLCLAWNKGIKCLLCVETCPRFAIRINADGRPVIDEERCFGCGACEAHCPVADSAVILTNRGEIRRSER